MIYRDKVYAKLRLLKEKGQLQRSQCSSHFLHLLRPLLATNVIVEHRSGSGRRLVVRDHATLGAFIEQKFHDVEFEGQLPRRVQGVQRFRDSKAFSSDNPEIVQVRAWRNVLTREGHVVDAVRDTKVHSVFSFQLDSLYRLHDRCALVEGPVMFSCFERLDLDVALVIYGEGRLSARLLDWLAMQTDAKFSLLHLPDFDPVGLDDFERIRGRLESRVCLYLPLNLGDLFERYSKPELLAKRRSQSLLAKLRRSNSREVQSVVELIDKHNAGLEQEALLIGATAKK